VRKLLPFHDISYPDDRFLNQRRNGELSATRLLRSNSLDEESPPEYRLPMRARPRPKPEGIFIHPNLSNIARADARALERGLISNTDRVHSTFYSRDTESGWQSGSGKEAARALLGGPGHRRNLSSGSDSD
jgi:hypothetical protein